MPTEERLVAEATFLFVDADGRARKVTIAVGQPHRDESGTWACRVQMQGLQPAMSPIRGEDSLQALSLGLSFAHKLCVAFTRKGGRILFPGTNEDVPLPTCFPTYRQD